MTKAKIVLKLIAISLILSTAQAADTDNEFADKETIDYRPYTNFEYGLENWEELLIGFTLAAPISWARFYMSGHCSKLVTHLTNDIVEGALYWNELTMAEEGWIIYDPDDIQNADAHTIDRNVYYLLINNASILTTIPQIYNHCSITQQ